MSRMNEKQATAHLVAWLRVAGWTVVEHPAEMPHLDVLATRGAERWLIEVKGYLASDNGTSADICWGQTLRRMTDPGPTTRYSIAAPTKVMPMVFRVPEHVRACLRVEVLEVEDGGNVVVHQG